MKNYALVFALFVLVSISQACTSDTSSASQSVDTQQSTITNEKVITNAIAIIDSSVNDTEKILGKPTEVYSWNANEIDTLPNGGESREYKTDKFAVDVSYYKDIAVGIQIVEGLESEDYRLDDWQTVLARIGVVNTNPPDRTAPAGVYWDNHQGYRIEMVTDKIGGNVWTVKIYRPNK